MRELNKTQEVVLKIGALMLVAGVAMASMRTIYSVSLYAVGAVLFCSMQMLCSYEGQDFVVRRLRRQQIFGLLSILVSAALYTMEVYELGPDKLRHNYWLVALGVGCIFLTYTVFRLSAEMKKLEKK